MAGIMLLHMVSIHSGIPVSALLYSALLHVLDIGGCSCCACYSTSWISRWQQMEDVQAAKNGQDAVSCQVCTHKLWCKELA